MTGGNTAHTTKATGKEVLEGAWFLVVRHDYVRTGEQLSLGQLALKHLHNLTVKTVRDLEPWEGFGKMIMSQHFCTKEWSCIQLQLKRICTGSICKSQFEIGATSPTRVSVLRPQRSALVREVEIGEQRDDVNVWRVSYELTTVTGLDHVRGPPYLLRASISMYIILSTVIWQSATEIPAFRTRLKHGTRKKKDTSSAARAFDHFWTESAES